MLICNSLQCSISSGKSSNAVLNCSAHCIWLLLFTYSSFGASLPLLLCAWGFWFCTGPWSLLGPYLALIGEPVGPRWIWASSFCRVFKGRFRECNRVLLGKWQECLCGAGHKNLPALANGLERARRFGFYTVPFSLPSSGGGGGKELVGMLRNGVAFSRERGRGAERQRGTERERERERERVREREREREMAGGRDGATER